MRARPRKCLLSCLQARDSLLPRHFPHRPTLPSGHPFSRDIMGNSLSSLRVRLSLDPEDRARARALARSPPLSPFLCEHKLAQLTQASAWLCAKQEPVFKGREFIQPHLQCQGLLKSPHLRAAARATVERMQMPTHTLGCHSETTTCPHLPLSNRPPARSKTSSLRSSIQGTHRC